LSKNSAKRAIGTFVMGRKGWLFCNGQRGAKAIAAIYSIVETAKENGLNRTAYRAKPCEEGPNMDIADPQKLKRRLPWSKELPAMCRNTKTNINLGPPPCAGFSSYVGSNCASVSLKVWLWQGNWASKCHRQLTGRW